MNNAANGLPRCTVAGDDKLEASLGGSAAICNAMESALAAAPAGAGASVRVEVVTPNAAVAQVTVGGRALPEQRIDVSDRTLNLRAFEMLANGIAEQLRALRGNADPAQ